MAKRLPAPAEVQRVRLDLDKQHSHALDMAAARCGLSLASFVRLAVEMLVTAKDGSVSLDAIRDRAGHLTGSSPEEKPAPKKGKK
jgi:hypothetical protein